ncbi:hypothetical protein HDU67_000871 [Dinochytrium kinnereticum]|nr:hypothetical protein HDU67_000871 [Dinochytrium kinnereticum]
MVKVKSKLKNKNALRHDPLHMEILQEKTLETPNPILPEDPKAKRRAKKASVRPQQTPQRTQLGRNDDTNMSDGEEAKGSFVDTKTSKRILDIVRDQQMEMSMEDKEDREEFRSSHSGIVKKTPMPSIPSVPIRQEDSDNDVDLEEVEEYEEYEEEYDDDTNLLGGVELDAAEAAIMEKFMTKEPKRQLNLAELIMSKIDESENRRTDAVAAIDPTDRKASMEHFQSSLDPKVVEVYAKVGLLLSRYRSGKLPKAFKIIPSLPQWEEVLFLTNPEGWTPHATYQATRIFVSNLGARLAQRFFAHVLLDRIRDDIGETKKLNHHLYLALKKALYKPAAFFKGILFPLCESGNCSLREAAIIGSVITKVSIPMEHSAAALLKIAEMDYTGPNSLFLRILLDKKYALPYKVVDALVLHFIRFKSDHRALPVLWHQALLVFAQRYKGNVTEEQKEALLELIKAKYHPSISAEIRRELESSQGRDEMALDL